MYEGERFNSITHLVGSVLALIATAVAITLAATHADARTIAAVTIYGGMLVVLYLSSTLYHSLRGPAKKVFHVFDHTSIYLLIAGTYTPVGLLVLRGDWRWVVLGIVWSGASAAVVLKFVWVEAPKWLAVAIGIALGWVAVVVFPQLLDRIGVAGSMLALAGGLAYTAGALVYAFRRPDPVPAVFGYHELFHALVIVAVACHYSAVAFYVLPDH